MVALLYTDGQGNALRRRFTGMICGTIWVTDQGAGIKDWVSRATGLVNTMVYIDDMNKVRATDGIAMQFSST